MGAPQPGARPAPGSFLAGSCHKPHKDSTHYGRRSSRHDRSRRCCGTAGYRRAGENHPDQPLNSVRSVRQIRSSYDRDRPQFLVERYADEAPDAVVLPNGRFRDLSHRRTILALQEFEHDLFLAAIAGRRALLLKSFLPTGLVSL